MNPVVILTFAGSLSVIIALGLVVYFIRKGRLEREQQERDDSQ